MPNHVETSLATHWYEQAHSQFDSVPGPRDIMQKNRVLPEGGTLAWPKRRRTTTWKCSAKNGWKPATVIMEELSNLFMESGGKGTDTVMNEIEKVLKFIKLTVKI